MEGHKGKFVGFQILERDEERGQIFPYPASAEDVATQLHKMGWSVLPPGEYQTASLDVQKDGVELSTYQFTGDRRVKA